jgi:hypothetical protein
MKRSLATAALLLALAAAPGRSAHAQQSSMPGTPQGEVPPPVTLEAYRPSDALEISLDGRLDEAVWQSARPIVDFTQQEPAEGARPSEDTEIRVVYDQDALYIGVMIYDDPEGVLAYQRERDAPLSTDDRFMWILDTFRDGRTGYFFEINAAGLMGDGVITGGGGGGGGPGGFGGGGTNKAWDGIWEAQTQMLPNGWSAEIQIPFRTLNFNPNQTEWGINFQRTIRRRNEEILWRGWRRAEGLRNPVFAGRLTGLSGMSQGMGLEAVPSAVQKWNNTPADPVDPTTFPNNVSLDVNYSVTSSLRASASVNTDFAEVESDQRQVNLTRFYLRFPERRDFFLEGSGVFSFAPRSGPSPFYSRNIGIYEGRQVPITYGTRLTGQAGRFELGFYQIGTSKDEFLDPGDITSTVTIPRESFTIARVKRRVWEQSAIGVMYTRRGTDNDPTGFAPIPQHTAGVDLDFKTRNFLGNKNLELEAFYAWNSNPLDASHPEYEQLTTTDLSSHGLLLHYPNDIWTGHVSYRQFGDDYKPAVGFVPRNNFRRIEPRFGWSPRTPGISWLRRLDFSVQFRELVSLDENLGGKDAWLLRGVGGVEERQWEFNFLGVNFESGDSFDFQASQTYEYLDREFEPSEGIVVVPGDYTNWEYSLRGRTAGQRRVSLFGNVSKGGYWDGDRFQYGGRISFRPNPGVTISTNLQRNEVEMPTGDFDVNVYELSTDWTPTPWVATTWQLQYDNQSEVVGLFARLRWIVKPGNDIYLVYSQNWRYDALDPLDPNNRSLETLSRGASVKAKYTYRF